MFSIITMASSTTKPMQTASAINDRLSIENPAAHIAAQVPASDSGTVMPAASVGAERRRNSTTTNITRIAVAPERELHVVHAGADGLCAVGQHRNLETGGDPLRAGSAGLDASTMSTHWHRLLGDDEQDRRVFVVPAGRKAVAHAGARSRLYWTGGSPCRSMVFTTSGSYSIGVRSWLLMPMVMPRLAPSKLPSGPTELALAIAVRTSSMLTPMAAMRPGSTRTRMAGCSDPATVTSPTPSTWLSRCAMMLSAAS